MAPEPFDTPIPPESTDVPGALDPPPDSAPRWVTDFLRRRQGSDRLTDQQLRRAHQCYYGLVAFLDTQFARLLDWMEAQRLLGNTIIAFTSDHGAHLGDQGIMQKQTFYDPVVNVPFFFHAPGRIAGGARIRTPVETLSLLPTLLDLAGLLIPEECANLSLAATLASRDEPPDRPVFSELTQATWDYRPEDRLAMVRRGQWKLSLFYDGPSTDPFSEWADASLYDLAADPGERHNLIDTDQAQSAVPALMADLAAGDEAAAR